VFDPSGKSESTSVAALPSASDGDQAPARTFSPA
jgi:hypothetical protein